MSADSTAIGHHTSSVSKQTSDVLFPKTMTPGTTSECGVGEEDKDATPDIKDEPADFIETNCHWIECEREFPSQEDLVKVKNLK